MTTPYRAICLFAAASIVLSGCVTAPLQAPGDDLREAKAGSVLRSLSIDRAVEDRILALDPERIGEDDVRDALAKGPTPRIFEVAPLSARAFWLAVYCSSSAALRTRSRTSSSLGPTSPNRFASLFVER